MEWRAFVGFGGHCSSRDCQDSAAAVGIYSVRFAAMGMLVLGHSILAGTPGKLKFKPLEIETVNSEAFDHVPG